MHDLGYELLKLWVLWYASAAFVGAFFGTIAALAVRGIVKKITLKVRGKR